MKLTNTAVALLPTNLTVKASFNRRPASECSAPCRLLSGRLVDLVTEGDSVADVSPGAFHRSRFQFLNRCTAAKRFGVLRQNLIGGGRRFLRGRCRRRRGNDGRRCGNWQLRDAYRMFIAAMASETPDRRIAP